MPIHIVRLYKVVHTWTGIVAGLFLFVAFYAGTITVFERSIERWATPPAAIAPTDLGDAHELIALTLATRTDSRREFTLHLGDADSIPARLTWQKSREDTEPLASSLTDDGGVLVRRLHTAPLSQFIDDLHRTAGIPEVELGSTFMGVVSALYALALVSGLIIVIPSLAKDFLALRIGPNLKRMWLDAHNLVGVASLPFHLVIALSAAVFGLHDVLYDAMDRVIYEDNLPKVMRAGNPLAAIPPDRRRVEMLPPQDLLARLAEVAPGFTPTAMQYKDAGTMGASVRVWGKDERYLMRGKGFAVMSPVSGQVVNTSFLPGHQNTYAAVVASFFALHFASFGGPAVKGGYVILGLAGAFLFYSGNLLWIETRRRRERESGESPTTRRMAALTVGACLGCMVGVSAVFVAARWLEGRVANPGLWLHVVYLAVFAGAIAWAFARGSRRAGRHLLWLAAAVTAAIPVSSLATWPGQGAGIDLTAGVAALILAVMAIRSRPALAERHSHGDARQHPHFS